MLEFNQMDAEKWRAIQFQIIPPERTEIRNEDWRLNAVQNIVC